MPRLKCECGRNVAYEPHQAGKKIRCPGCKKSLLVPDDEEDEDDEEEDDEEEEEEEKPQAKGGGRKAKPIGALANIGILVFSGPGAVLLLIVITIGGGLLAYGLYEYQISSGAKAEPTTVTCATIVSSGIPENANAIVSEFMMGTNYTYVLKVPKSEKEKVGSSLKTPPWQMVLVPIVPMQPEYRKLMPIGTPTVYNPPPSGSQIRLLLLCRDIQNESELNKLVANNTVQGLVAKADSRLDRQTKEEIVKNYSGIDMDKLFVLEEGRKPSSPVFTIALMLGGVFFLVLAATLVVMGYVYRPR